MVSRACQNDSELDATSKHSHQFFKKHKLYMDTWMYGYMATWFALFWLI